MGIFSRASLSVLGLCCLVGFVTPASAKTRKKGKSYTIAVMAFKNTSADRKFDSLGRGLQSMMTTDLAQVTRFRLVERGRLNEILAEHKLARSGYADRRQAVKLGKIVGATHLLGGTFVIHNKKMRVDARLYSTKTGRIVLAKKVSGEQDAFFELQKKLVNDVILSLGVKLAPRQRAKVGRIHTADFKAFRKFSQGLRSFDEKRYLAALEALRAASRIDADFKLAKLTLGEYERVISRLRLKAKTIRTANQELKRLKRDKRHAQVAALVSRLLKIAERRGKRYRVDRATAIWLALKYLRSDGPRSQGIDRFAIRRLRTNLYRRYYNLAIALFPSLPLRLSSSRGVRFDAAKPFRSEFEAAKRDLLGRINVRRWAPIPSSPGTLQVSEVRLTNRGIASLYGTLFSLAIRNAPIPGPRTGNEPLRRFGVMRSQGWQALAELHRLVLDLDKSTTFYRRLAAGRGQPRVLERVAREIAINRDMKRYIMRSKNRPLMREYLQTVSGGCRWSGHVSSSWKRRADLFLPRRPGMAAISYINGRRKLCDPTWIGDQPVFPVGARPWLLTDRRVESFRANALRYYPRRTGSIDSRADTIVVVGDAPRARFRASFMLNYTPADDWWPSPTRLRVGTVRARDDTRIDRARPTVAFFFAARHIDVPFRYVEATRTRVLDLPMRGIAIEIHPGGVRLVTFKERPNRSRRRRRAFDRKVEATHALRLSSTSIKVAITVDPKRGQVTVNLNGDQVTLRPKRLFSGYGGFVFRGPGYVEVSKLRVR